MTNRILCTVQVLTRNNAGGLKKCLDSLDAFDEVLVQDGYSTDGTREMASQYPNVRLMDQNKTFLNDEGRITDFASMRNESIRAAKHDWVFVVDGDEYVDPDLIANVRAVVEKNEPGVFQAFRRFTIDGEPVMHCSGYPAYQIRLFHRGCIEGYVKPVHERLNLKDGVQVQTLRAELPVPQPPVASLTAKYDRYLAMEVKRAGVMPFWTWVRWVLIRNIRSMVGLSIRLLWIWLIPRKGKRMPLSHELAYIRHSFRTILHTFPPRVAAKLRRPSATSAM